MEKRNSVLCKIIPAVFTAIGIFILICLSGLFWDKIRAKKLAKKMYPTAEILYAVPTNQLTRSTVACLLYDSEYHLVFQQDFERSWFRMHAAEVEGHGFDAALERRRQIDEALAAFAEQTTVPYLTCHTSDGYGVCIYTTEQDPDILSEMHARFLSLQAPDAVQPFSIVSCSAEEYTRVQNTPEDKFIRRCAELNWTAERYCVATSAADPARMFGFVKADTEFTWNASSVRAAYDLRASFIENGKMNEYPEFNADTPLTWYCEVYGTSDSVHCGVRQWAASGKQPTYNSRTESWEDPVGQSYIFNEGVVIC